jgi:hypothetical protein
MTYISRDQRNEYYLGFGSNANTGALYVKKARGGYSLISYSKLKDEFHIMLIEFSADFHPAKFTKGQEPRQISKLDVIPILQSIRNKIIDL